MAVTATTKRALEIYGTIENDLGTFPRDISSVDFRKYLAYKSRIVYGTGTSYTAFPFAELVGGSVVGLCSSGPGHAASDRQVMFVYNPTTDVIQTVDFVTDAAPTTFNTSLISPLMANGDVLTLKVWTLTKTAGVVSVSTLSTQIEGATTYAFWSSVKKRTSTGIYYRIGYGGDKVGLFSSPNGQAPWTFVVDIFSDAGKAYTECDFTWRADDTLLFVVRETTGGSSTGNLYWKTSNGAGGSPSAATLYTTTVINGVQPQLRTLLDGSILLVVGDRTGSSGSTAGVNLFGPDSTGIASWLLPSASTAVEGNWGPRQMLEQFYSSDGGQPWPVLLASGEIVCPFYARRSVGSDPIIYLFRFDATKI